MSTVRQTGISPQYGQTIHDVAAQSAIGAKGPAEVSPQLSLGLDDTINQTVGASGSAVTALETSPHSDKIRALLNQGDFDAIRALVQNSSTRLGQLDLSLSELTKIAEGMGQGSWNQSLPLLGSYTDDERAVVLSLIQSSQLSPSERINALETMSGDEAVMSYLRSTPASEFSGLSTADRVKVLGLISSGTSVVDDVSGAAKELFQRRVAGQTHQVNDRLASKILLSSRNDSERVFLLDQINQFNRDDVVYRYVMDLGPRALEGLSDKMKIELLKRLIDTSVSVVGLKLDLNNLGNLDEALNLVSETHASAAARLVESLKPEARNSVEVQTLVQKSDHLMERLNQIEQSLKQEMASGQLNSQKLNNYSQQLQEIQSQYGSNPELAAKIQSLQQILEQAKTQMDRTQQSGQVALDAAKDLGQAVEQAAHGLETSRAELKTFAENLSRSETQLKSLETQILQKYEAFYQNFSQVEQVGTEFTQLVSEMQGLLGNGQAARSKLPQLERITKQLQTLAQNVKTEQSGQKALFQQLDQSGAVLDSLRSAYDQAANNFNIDCSSLEVKKQHMASALQVYSQELTKLENKQEQAQTILKAIDAGGVKTSDFQPMQAALDEISQATDKHRATRNRIQTEVEQTLIPQSVALLEAEGELAGEWHTFSTQLASAESQQDRVEMIRVAALDAVDRVENLVSSLLGDVSNFTDLIKKRLSQASPEELQTILGEVNQKMMALQQAGVPIEKLQAGLQELDALRTLIGDMVGHIGAVSTVQDGMQSEMTQMQNRRELLNSQLSQASERVGSASEKLAEAEAVLQNTRQNLADLGLNLDTYQADVEALQKQLNAVEQVSQEAKAAFMKAMKESPKNAGDNSVAEQFKASLNRIETRRTELKTQLSTANHSVAAVASRLEYEQQELSRQEQVIQTQTALLTEAQTQLTGHKTELTRLDDKSQQLLAQANNKLAEYQGGAPDNQALQAQLNALKASRDSLQTGSLHSKELMVQANQELAGAVTALHKARTQTTDIQALRTKIASVQIDLPKVNADLATLEQRFASIEAKRLDVVNQAGQLLLDLKSGDHVMTMEEVKARGAALMLGIEHAETFEALKEMMLPLMRETRKSVQASMQAMQHWDQQANTIHTLVAEAEGLFGDTEVMSDAIAVLQTEMSDAQTGLLEIQRQLLQQRRGLGIDSGDYQDILSRYASLLEGGNNLSLEQVQELQGLEQQLSMREASLVSGSEGLTHQIESLNSLKSRVNQQVGHLRNKIQQLSALRDQLVTQEPELRASQEALLAHRETMLEQRHLIVNALQKLRDNFGNLAEAQTQIVELEGLLKSLDQGLGSVTSRINQTQSLLHLIDQTVTDIDSEIAIARLQLAQLELLSGQLDSALEDAMHLKTELDYLLAQVRQIKKDAEAVLADVSTDEPRIQDSRSADSHGKYESPGQFNTEHKEQQKSGFARKLSDQFTNFWSGRRRQESADLEKNHQEQREAFLEVMDQRLALSGQYHEELAVSVQKQEMLEQITEHLVSEAHQGQNKTSSINIVNVTGNE